MWTAISEAHFDSVSHCRENEMNGSRYYGVRVEGAKFGVGFGSALAITISYSENHSILWAIIEQREYLGSYLTAKEAAEAYDQAHSRATGPRQF